MRLHENKHVSFFLCVLYIILFAGAGYLFFKTLFPLLLPLLVAYVLAQVISRPLDWLGEKTPVPRKALALALTLLCVTAAGGAVGFVLYRIVYEVSQLLYNLPGFLESLPEKLSGVQALLSRLAGRLPGFMADAPLFDVQSWLSSLSLPQVDIGALWAKLSQMMASFPGALFTVIFVFVSTYFMASERVAINAFLHRQMSAKVIVAVERTRLFLHESLFKWLKAQGILIGITFLQLLAGFLLMRQPYALVLAIVIAAVDALPILGTGTVLIPWAAVCLLTGDVRQGVSLAVLFAVLIAVRNVIEPRIVGGQLGLNPFVALLCLYFGFRLAGVGGMFALPVLMLVLLKLHEWEYIKIWK